MPKRAGNAKVTIQGIQETLLLILRLLSSFILSHLFPASNCKTCILMFLERISTPSSYQGLH